MSLVELALSQSPDTQEAYLRTACAGDTELLTQVLDYVRWNHRMQDSCGAAVSGFAPASVRARRAAGGPLPDRA